MGLGLLLLLLSSTRLTFFRFFLLRQLLCTRLSIAFFHIGSLCFDNLRRSGYLLPFFPFGLYAFSPCTILYYFERTRPFGGQPSFRSFSREVLGAFFLFSFSGPGDIIQTVSHPPRRTRVLADSKGRQQPSKSVGKRNLDATRGGKGTSGSRTDSLFS